PDQEDLSLDQNPIPLVPRRGAGRDRSLGPALLDKFSAKHQIPVEHADPGVDGTDVAEVHPQLWGHHQNVHRRRRHRRQPYRLAARLSAASSTYDGTMCMPSGSIDDPSAVRPRRVPFPVVGWVGDQLTVWKRLRQRAGVPYRPVTVAGITHRLI